MEPSEIQDLIHELQSPSLVMDENQLANAQRACAVVEDIATERCREVIRLAHKGPVLQMFMSDGWSCDMRYREASCFEDNRVESRARMRTEFLLQRALLKCRRGDELHLAVKIQRPRPLATKKCDDVWCAASEFCPVLALSGHKGIGIHVYIQDGLFASPFGKRMLARHALFWQKAHCPLTFTTDAEMFLAELRDWVYTTGCFARSCSKALKWGMRALVVGCDELLEAIHISVSALLRGSQGLFRAVPEFIAGFVVLDVPEVDNTEDIVWFWTCLDVHPKLIDLFVRVNPQWRGDRLHCSASLSGAPDMMTALTTCIHACMHWTDFSETRWTKVGVCARQFLKSLCIGIDKISHLAMGNDAVCKWHLGGFHKKCSGPVRLYLATAALSARPTEAMLLELLEDDRFLLKHDRCLDALLLEHRFLEKAPAYFFETISAIVNVDCDLYRASVLESSLTSISYLQMDIFGELSKAPLKYVIGNLQDNIELLKNDDDATDPLTLKWKGLATLCFEEELAQGLELFRETAFTTTLVEQAHASGSLTMRRHPTLEINSLIARMTLHNCRMLFCDSALDRQLSHLQSLLDRTDKQLSNVHHTGARQMYVKALLEEVEAQRLRGRPSDTSVRLSVFKHHSKCFDELGGGQVAALRQRASVFNAKKVESLDVSRTHILGQLGLLRERAEEEKRHGLVNHMKSIRYRQEDYARFSDLWAQYTPREYSNRLLAPPNGIPPAMQTLLRNQMAKSVLPEVKHPDWLSYMVDLRDDFAGTAFFADSKNPNGDVMYKLLLAIAQPRRVMFLECHRVKRLLSEQTSHGCYQYQAFRIIPHGRVPWKDSSDIWVIPQSWVKASEVHTAGEPVPFSVYTRFLRRPAPARTKGEGTSGPRSTRYDLELLHLLHVEYPWLTMAEIMELLKMNSPQASAQQPMARPLPSGASSSSTGNTPQGSAQQPRATPQPSGASSSSRGQGSSRPEAEELPEDIVARVHDNIAAIRAAVGEDNHETRSFFNLKALGGPWSVKQGKALTTDFQSIAKDKSIATWCANTLFPERKSFSTNHYGHLNARMLAEEVGRRGDYFYGAWEADECAVPYDYNPLVAGYRSPVDYINWFDELPLNSPSARAAFEIREMVPYPLLE